MVIEIWLKKNWLLQTTSDLDFFIYFDFRDEINKADDNKNERHVESGADFARKVWDPYGSISMVAGGQR